MYPLRRDCATERCSPSCWAAGYGAPRWLRSRSSTFSSATVDGASSLWSGSTAERGQVRETPREFVERESHYLWGRRYLLSVREKEAKPSIQLDHRRIVLTVRPG